MKRTFFSLLLITVCSTLVYSSTIKNEVRMILKTRLS